MIGMIIHVDLVVALHAWMHDGHWHGPDPAQRRGPAAAESKSMHDGMLHAWVEEIKASTIARRTTFKQGT